MPFENRLLFHRWRPKTEQKHVFSSSHQEQWATFWVKNRLFLNKIELIQSVHFIFAKNKMDALFSDFLRLFPLLTHMLKKTSGIWTVKFQKYWNLKKIWFVCKTMTCSPIWMIVPYIFRILSLLTKKTIFEIWVCLFPTKKRPIWQTIFEKIRKFLGKFSYRKSQFAVGNRQTITIKISFSNTSNKILSK